MKQYTHKEFVRIFIKNGFSYKGRHISVLQTLQCVIARRLIKENNLNLNEKRK